MKKSIEVLDPAECQALIDLVYYTEPTNHAYKKNVRDCSMILLMLDAGLRVGEVTKLEIDDLVFSDLPVKTLTVRSEVAKNQKERQIPLSPRIQNHISKMMVTWWNQLEDPAGRPAFTANGQPVPLTPRRVQQIVRKLGLLAFNKKIHPHILRHTFATRCMSKTNIRVVQVLLGHSSLSSTQIYTHPNGIDLQNAINALA